MQIKYFNFHICLGLLLSATVQWLHAAESSSSKSEQATPLVMQQFFAARLDQTIIDGVATCTTKISELTGKKSMYEQQLRTIEVQLAYYEQIREQIRTRPMEWLQSIARSQKATSVAELADQERLRRNKIIQDEKDARRLVGFTISFAMHNPVVQKRTTRTTHGSQSAREWAHK